MSLISDVQTDLKAYAALNDAVDGRIYKDQAPVSEGRSCVIVTELTTRRLAHVTVALPRIQIMPASKDPDITRSLADLILARYERFEGMIGSTYVIGAHDGEQMIRAGSWWQKPIELRFKHVEG